MPTAAGAAATRVHGHTGYRGTSTSDSTPEESLLAAVVARAIEDIQMAAKEIRKAEAELGPGIVRWARRTLEHHEVHSALELIDGMEVLGSAIKRRLAEDLETIGYWTEE